MTLDERLENWKRAEAGRGGSGGRDTLVASIYFPSVGGLSVDATLDVADAAAVEAAIRRLDPRHRDLLRMLYLWNAKPEFICRRLRIKVWPARHFELETAKARRALLGLLTPTVPVRTYVSMQAIIDRMEEKPLAETK
ncbi:hypothetical protein [Burkholderia gladioli]|uniref:hypothetical protein n=1 Tax=Burkholderia gladioli TaxID=28095 RepID=UPI00163F7752|nr:hypothetical protein [Burkholderia gladioli]